MVPQCERDFTVVILNALDESNMSLLLKFIINYALSVLLRPRPTLITNS